MPKFKEGRKRKTKTNIPDENKKLPSLILFNKLNIELEYINIVNRTKKLLCQYLDKKVGTSCPELSIILKTLPLCANHGGTLG